MTELRREIEEIEISLRREIRAEGRSVRRWMLCFFIPAWAGTSAMAIVVWLKL